jgi:uncharacterized membrane protein HdeD (DUF308 family)
MIMRAMMAEVEEVRRGWGWFLVLGIALIVTGTVAIVAAEIAAIASIFLFGWIVLIGGVFEAVTAFWARHWSGFFLQLLVGFLYAVVGLLILGNPVAAAAGLTLLLAVLFLTGGIFRLVSAISMHYPNWGWAVLDGLISVALGLMIWTGVPEASLLVIGTFVGIALLFRGWAWVMFALAVHRMPAAGDWSRQPAGDRVSTPV